MEPIRNELQIRRVAGRVVAQTVVESEIPMPSGRQVSRILYAQGQIENEIAETQERQVRTAGTLRLQLMCMDIENQVFGMRAQTQYTHQIAMAGVQAGMRVQVQAQLLDMRCALTNGRIRLDAIAELTAAVQEQGETTVVHDIAGIGDVEKRYAEVTVGDWRKVGETLLRIHETVPIAGIESVLLADGATQTTSVSLTEGGANVQGMLYLGILYTDQDGQYTPTSQHLPYEAMVPFEVDARTCTQIVGTTRLKELEVAVSPDNDGLEIDVLLELIAHCIGSTDVRVLEDAYTPDGSFCCTQEEMEQLSTVAHSTKVCTYTENIRVPDDREAAFRPLFVSARPMLLGVFNNGGQLAADGMLVATVIYQTDEGILMCFEEDIPIQCTLDAPFMADSEVSLTLLEARINGSGRALNATFTVETAATLQELTRLRVVTDTQAAEPLPRANGVMVHFASASDTYWDIGKRYGVSLENLRNWNPDVQEPFAEGQAIILLLAPTRTRRAG